MKFDKTAQEQIDDDADIELYGFKEYAERLEMSYPQDKEREKAIAWLDGKKNFQQRDRPCACPK